MMKLFRKFLEGKKERKLIAAAMSQTSGVLIFPNQIVLKGSIHDENRFYVCKLSYVTLQARMSSNGDITVKELN